MLPVLTIFRRRRDRVCFWRLFGIVALTIMIVSSVEVFPWLVCLKLEEYVKNKGIGTDFLVSYSRQLTPRPILTWLAGSAGNAKLSLYLAALLTLQGASVALVCRILFCRLIAWRLLVGIWLRSLLPWWIAALAISMPATVVFNSPFWMSRNWTDPVYVQFTCFLLILGSYPMIIANACWKIRRRAMRTYGYCRGCGYLLRELTRSRCPECGTPFERRESAETQPHSKS